ncbi:MAG: rRNA maturation RNase YbeY [Myxococcota bacterium]
MKRQKTEHLIKKRIQTITTVILRDLGFNLFDVSYSLTDDNGIRELNSKYRHINRTTDVLSFPQYDFYRGDLREPILFCNSKIPLGDVVISLETIMRRSRSQKRRFNDYLLKVVIHAILHLIGFDHTERSERKIMREREMALYKIYRKEFFV